MPLAFFLAGPAQGNALVHQHIISDLSGFPDDDAGAMIDKKPTADARSRVDLDTGEKAAELRNHARQQRHTPQVQAASEPIQQNTTDSALTEQNLEPARCRRTSFEHRAGLLP